MLKPSEETTGEKQFAKFDVKGNDGKKYLWIDNKCYGLFFEHFRNTSIFMIMVIKMNKNLIEAEVEPEIENE